VAKKKPKKDRRVAVIDAETDPFKHGRVPEPFAWGFYDGERYVKFWGDDCTEHLIDFLSDIEEELIIYAHNGGKFDFFYFIRRGMIKNPLLVINGRVTKSAMFHHELRDSFAILPLPLEKLGGKKSIDYAKMERNRRERHKREILEYLEADCFALYDKVFKFRERFGDKLTIASTAINELGKIHKNMVSRRGPTHDGAYSEREFATEYGFRRFYYGGRVEAFETGEIHSSLGALFHVYDINSSYPKSMRDYDHPATSRYITMGNEMLPQFDRKTGKFETLEGMYFMRFIGKNKGALPSRDENYNLTFNKPEGEFFACSHEIEIACKYGLIEIERIIELLAPMEWGRFERFVDVFAAEKKSAKLAGDHANETFAKLILNSSYGKFASNPFKYKNWYAFNLETDSLAEFEKWKEENTIYDDDLNLISEPTLEMDIGDVELWKTPTEPNWNQFLDVAVAASITSASRAALLEAIVTAKRPIYCDTDSLICEAIGNVKISETDLGAWKYEGSAKTVWIAGKKNYCMEIDDMEGIPQIDKNGLVKTKMATKGSRISFDQMKRAVNGEEIFWEADAPNFRLNGEVKFVSRKIKKTA